MATARNGGFMKKFIIVLLLCLSLFSVSNQFSFATDSPIPIEAIFQKSGNLQFTIYRVTINNANKNNFKDFLANILINNNYNIDYSNDYQLTATKTAGIVENALIGNSTFLFNFSQDGNNVQFIGKSKAGFEKVLFSLMLDILILYTGQPVHWRIIQ